MLEHLLSLPQLARWQLRFSVAGSSSPKSALPCEIEYQTTQERL
jgi:hypothetical protein